MANNKSYQKDAIATNQIKTLYLMFNCERFKNGIKYGDQRWYEIIPDGFLISDW